ncbi:MAG: DUF3131 domain-containing protein [Chloroflexi bacterium AL-W]|nr:DUF3131 domain-containing protein [Chloroflexi bacterium AL-N1]NOK71611.1 DUF3131 domain-containing protein [Chloroflexi bacterium AL-N10]NOK78911.1 DUF3131 domain-containing protein [Chloroflexi bacterium AL-N5]NOK86386.1 DUF3131 domain-containing protein [Chloroflexi bacterium AL-W]
MHNTTKYLKPLLVLVMLASMVLPVHTLAQTDDGERISKGDFHTLYRYAADTWQSFVAMASPTTGLPADNLSAEGVRSAYTSPTNIGTYLWSTIVARDLRLISRQEARERISAALDSVAQLERHEASGQFYNWYHPDTLELLTEWPDSGDPIYPFLSSVDNGWLAAALIIVNHAEPRLRSQSQAILADMNFGSYYDPEVGQIRGGFWDAEPPGCAVAGTVGDSNVFFTCHHYGAFNTEPRIASYIGIAMGDIPPEHYFRTWRTFPDTCDWSWQEMKPGGEWHTYMGVEVFAGHYTYRGMRIVPTWGGSMFEALMVPLLIPEEDWGPHSWGINHPLYVQAQIEHGLEEAQYGYWGFSPSNNPAGGYREYGVDAIGMDSAGYTSNQERTSSDYGFTGCPDREPQPLPTPEDYTNGVVTPHASFLALDFAPRATLDNLDNLQQDFDIYGEYGFYDAVNVDTGEVSQYYLALDQGMIMAAIGNELRQNRLQHYFTRGAVERHVRPLIEMEVFTAGE